MIHEDENVKMPPIGNMVPRNQRSSRQVKKKDAAGSFEAAFPLAAKQVHSQRELEVPRMIWMDDHTTSSNLLSFFLLGFNSLNFNLISSDLEAMDLITYRLGGDFAVANLSQSIGRMQCTSSSDPLPVITSYPYN